MTSLESWPPISMMSASGSISAAALRLGGDLVLDEVGADEAADQVAARAGDAHPGDIHAGRPLGQKKVAEDLFHGVDGPSGGHQVVLGQDVLPGPSMMTALVLVEPTSTPR